MSFIFHNPADIDENMFNRCVSIVAEKDGIDLHVLNDAVMKEYNKTINEFLSYLITVGEHLEEYEKCSQLIIQQKKYKKWLKVNLETAKQIAQLLKELNHKHDNKEND